MLEHKFALHESEHLRNTYRQSVLFIIKPAFITILISLLPAYFLWRYNLLTSYANLNILVSMLAMAWFLRTVLIWWRNCYILTNQRLMIFEHKGLFRHTVVETPLERILNVSYKTTGIMSSLWQFGDVEVQVVGLYEPIILRHVPDPEYIKDYLWQMHKRMTQKQVAFNPTQIDKVQEDVGYTKRNQKIF